MLKFVRDTCLKRRSCYHCNDAVTSSLTTAQSQNWERRQKLLVVEDLAPLNFLVTTWFQGVDTIQCYSAEDAIRLIPVMQEIDLYVFTDNNLGTGKLTGLDLTRILRLLPRCTVVGTSSDPLEDDFLSAGASLFIRKPSSKESVINAFKSLGLQVSTTTKKIQGVEEVSEPQPGIKLPPSDQQSVRSP